MRIFAVLLLLAVSAPAAQFPADDNSPPPPGKDVPLRLPNGKLQRDAIAKEDFQKNLEDSRDLAKLAEGLKSELEKSDANIVSLSAIKKTEEIEKLAKRIRGRMKR